MDEKEILSYLKELFSKIKATRSFLREKILEESQKLPENEKSMVGASRRSKLQFQGCAHDTQ